MAAQKSIEINEAFSFLGLLHFLATPRENVETKDKTTKQISDGFFQMLNGLSTVLKGAEEKLNEMIEGIMKNQQSLLSDSDLEAIQQLETLVASIRPFLGNDAGMPDELRRLIARVIERGEMLKSLELQFRPFQGEVIHVQFNSNILQKEANKNRDINASGWDDE